MSGARALLERDHELAAIDDLIAEVATGRGGSLVVAGLPGIGKTTLVREALRRARSAGLRVLAIRPDEVDAVVAFGVIRDLLIPALVRHEQTPSPLADLALATLYGSDHETGSEATSRATSQATSEAGMLHGLYWLVADLAARGPLLLAVDDAQWADAASLRFLDHLVRRLDGMPVALLVALRLGSGEDALRRVSAGGRDDVVRPAPLSLTAVQKLVQAEFDSRVPDELARVVRDCTDGNPHAVHELIMTLIETRTDPHDATPGLVRELGAAAVSGGAHLRLERVGADAVSFAEALAVVGSLDGPAAVGDLVGLCPDRSRAAASELQVADVLAPGPSDARFVHPLMREAVRDGVRRARRDTLSLAAARWCVERDDDVAAAGHLLARHPAGDPWVAEVLLRAADSATERGAPDVALELARRAAAEPPAPELRPTVLAALGRVELALGGDEAVDHLREAVAGTHDTATRASTSESLALALVHRMQVRDAADVLGDAAALLRPDDQERADQLELRKLLFAHWSRDLRFLLAGQITLERGRQRHGAVARRLSLLLQGIDAVASCQPVEQGVDLVESALVDDVLADHDPSVAMMAVPILLACGRPGRARRFLEPLVTRLGSVGDLPVLRAAVGLRGQVALARGDVLAAETDGAAMETLFREGTIGPAYLLGFYTETLLARGLVDQAAADLGADGLLSRPLPDLSPNNAILWARARVRAAQGDAHAAIDDLVTCGERQDGIGQLNPGLLPWRGALAEVLGAVGRHAEATEVSDEDVARSRAFGADHVIGSALRVRATATGVTDVAMLDEALVRLGRSPARLEHARALRDRGVAFLADGERSAAREILGQAGGLAHQLGATALAVAATADLVRAGGRPRRVLTRGAASLTPAERRVADLAATGATNRAIAETLFVTEKTVETHLRGCFRKLGLGSRAQLGRALE